MIPSLVEKSKKGRSSLRGGPRPQGFRVGEEAARLPGSRGVPKAQRDECPQLWLRNDLMTKIIRLSADTKESWEPQPARELSLSIHPKTGQVADYRSVTSPPQSSCELCPPGHSLKKWPGGDELLTKVRALLATLNNALVAGPSGRLTSTGYLSLVHEAFRQASRPGIDTGSWVPGNSSQPRSRGLPDSTWAKRVGNGWSQSAWKLGQPG